MKGHSAWVAALVLPALPWLVSAAEPTRPDRLVVQEPRAQALNAAADALDRIGATGAVLVARDGKVLLARGFGSPGEGERPLTANTLFEIASATKQFTGAALALLADRGEVKLDASIAEYLPNVPEDSRVITVRQLLLHTTGIPGRNVAGGRLPLEQAVPAFLAGGPKHPPGTHWEYWNQGYALAAAIIEHVSGSGYADFLTRALFAPAGMITAGFTGDALPPGVQQAVGSSANGPARGALDHPYGSYGWQYKGMGGAVLNLWDLWAWDRALHTETPLSEAAKAELFRVGLEHYALGWDVETRDGRLTHSHGGAVRGFVSQIVRYPDDDGAIFVLCNNDRYSPRRMAQMFEGLLFDREVKLPPKPLEHSVQRALTGHYVDERGVEVDFKADGALTRAFVYRQGKRPPMSNDFVGVADNGDIVLYQWGSQIAIEIEQREDGRASVLVMGGKHRASRKP